MRIALLVHAFAPRSTMGVEVYTESLARALGQAGHQVEVFAAHRERSALHLAQRREQRGGFAVTWLTLSAELDDEEARRTSPGAAEAFGRFLDRERPDVVHVQHFLGFGASVIDEARGREIPVLFSAHDAFAFCDEYTLVAPDLTALDPLDASALARCRLARGVLDSRLEQHDGYLVQELAQPAVWNEVTAVLQDASADVRQGSMEVEAQRVCKLDAIDRADAIESPTQFLADAMARCGLQSPVMVRPLGIACEGLSTRKLEPEPTQDPLRVLYLGGYYEHKGVHVLLQAAARCQEAVQVCLRGRAGSSDYLGHLTRLAADAGAQLGGPYERDELGPLLAEADLLVLPSLWPENAPFVLREAFAAGCPVLVSDTPALRESVREGVDGKLLPAGDVAAWSAALDELAASPQSLQALRRGVRAPKTIHEDAEELLVLYRDLIEQRAAGAQRRQLRLPEHLQPFAKQYGAVAELPMRELSARAIAGLQSLSKARGISLDELDGARAMLGVSERLRERLADALRSDAWREQTASDRTRALAVAEQQVSSSDERARSESERAAWQEQLRTERDRRLAWIEQQLQAREMELAAKSEEWQLARDTALEWERRQQGEHRTLLALEQDLQERLAELDVGKKELAWTRDQLEHREAHVRELQNQSSTVALELEARRLENRAREQQLADLRGQVQELASSLTDLGGDREAARVHQQFLEGELEQHAQRVHSISAQLEEMKAELDWRAQEMAAAREQARSFLRRAFGSGLKRRTDGWQDETQEEPAR
ncbi:MAG: glycosyltransferase involved in cell wall biosynthesis [Candidatus Paceibacteria bacterium]|jgi:glycosyltransferase involved in cell wall biosynthesis